MQAQRPRIELVGLAFAVEGDGRDEERLSPRRHQLPVEHEATPARLLHAEDLNTFGHPFAHLLDELFGRELARGQG